MTDKYGRGPKSQVTLRMSVGGFVEPGPSTQAVVPYKLNSFDLDDWHVENGWPVPGAGAARTTDVYDITPATVTYPAPDAITTNADARWTALNFTGTSWSALQGSGTWTGTGTLKSSYNYKLGGVSYTVPGIKIDSDDVDYLTADLSAIAGNRYSMILVFKPFGATKVDSDSDNEVSYGLIAPSAPATGQPELRVRNNKLVIKQSSELDPRQPWTNGDRSFQHYMNRGAPSFLVWTAGANHFHFYLGDGPSTMERYGLGDPHDLPKTYGFRLGSYAADTTHTADMILFDVGFYNDILTGPQAASEVATLATAYGGK
jgi:hypothetical protein